MKKVFITRHIPEIGIDMLKKKKYKVIVSPHDRVLKPAELVKMAKGVDALLPLLTDKIDGKLLDAIGPQLKVVANYAVGYNNIDVDACKQRGVVVTNTPGVLTTAVAEHTFALLMALSKRIVESDKFTRAGKYKGWAPELLLGTRVQGKTLGIVGVGRIGHAVAQRAVSGMGMKVVYSDVKRQKDFEKKYNAKFMKLEKLMSSADFITLHVPLLPSTRHMISRKEIGLMKKTAYLINTSRGPVVDEKYLIQALDKKKIAGAALDVFECEPEITCDVSSHKKMKNFENLILTPHTASATTEARDAMSELAAQNIINVLSGRKAKTPV